MGIAAVLIAAALTPAVYTTLDNARADAGYFDAALWLTVGLRVAFIMFAGLTCILYDRFRRMRKDGDYWTCLCNEYRTGRGPRMERVWLGLGSTGDIKSMDAAEAELPERWKRRHAARRATGGWYEAASAGGSGGGGSRTA